MTRNAFTARDNEAKGLGNAELNYKLSVFYEVKDHQNVVSTLGRTTEAAMYAGSSQ